MTNVSRINEIMDVLRNCGLDCKYREVEKNNSILPAIEVKINGNLGCLFYVGEYIKQGRSNSDIIKEIMEKHHNTPSIPNFKAILTNKDLLLKNVFIRLVKGESNTFLTCPSEFPGIWEQYYIKFDNNSTDESMSITLRKDMIPIAGLDFYTLRRAAYANTLSDIELSDLGERTGMSFAGQGPAPIVVSNKRGTNGAAAILDYKNILWKLNWECAIMCPSSIHECLLIPIPNKSEAVRQLPAFTNLVKEVNRAEVKEGEWLADNAFVLTLDEVLA
ncbi:DUF5688 family protein [Lachnospira multipara]|uniref:DUF5688 family protein n=1 Tax=Lachnospira multipara TaxID=28051 RepID=UPI00048575F4|nr:DUF5688 family protein [Lachnospira multipara]